ncbi:unnamed protein product [Caenorhabditis angaria]|uniref:Uncharacterized protein n=1 Tax=Caenorhabditis angaria TaxID=860376 RepID=A0A9P1IR19_9PELO|nr:unnamed protein product [Caenorhabditis angaria]
MSGFALTLPEVFTFLKFIIHDERLPQLSKSELENFSYPDLLDDEKLKCLLDLLFKKSNGGLDIYVSPESIIEELKTVEQIPEMYRLFKDRETIQCFRIRNLSLQYCNEDHVYYSKNGLGDLVCQKMLLKTNHKLTAIFIQSWFFDCFIRKFDENMKNCFELIPEQAWKVLSNELDKYSEFEFVFNCNQKISENHINNLINNYLTENTEPMNRVRDNMAEILTFYPIENNQQLWHRIYMDISLKTEHLIRTMNKFKDLFHPFPKNKANTRLVPFMFSKELEDALLVVLKRKYPNKKIPKGLLEIENENERRLGIVNAVNFEEFRRILRVLTIQESDFSIIGQNAPVNNRKVFYPILSPYGKHCIFSEQYFTELIYYLTVVLEIFKSVNAINFDLVQKWIVKKCKDIFKKRDKLYLIEVWKYDEILKEAREELQIYKTEPIFEVPIKSSYEKNERFLSNLCDKTILRVGDIAYKDFLEIYHKIITFHIACVNTDIQNLFPTVKYYELRLDKIPISFDSSKCFSANSTASQENIESSKDRSQMVEKEENSIQMDFNRKNTAIETQLDDMKKLRQTETEYSEKLKTENSKLSTQLEEIKNKMKLEQNSEIEKLRKLLETKNLQIEKLEKNKSKKAAIENEKTDEKNLKVQMTNLKKNYREEMHKLKEESNNRNNQIHKLQAELKKSREELKAERLASNKLNDEALKKANEQMKKMKLELENLKFSDNAKNKTNN